MKKILLLIISLGIFNFSYAQLEKEDVQDIFTHIDVKAYPKFYVSFNTESANKHKMEDENLASYESLNTATLKIEYMKNFMKITGDTYTVFLPYDKIKYIHTIKNHSIQIRVSQ
jgi:hypothetical protein